MEQLKETANKLYLDNKYEDALVIYSNILKEDSNNYIVLCNRSATYIKLGKYNDSLIDAARSAKLRPDWAKAWGRVGASLYMLNKLDQALVAYNKANELEKNSIYHNMIITITRELDKNKFMSESMEILEQSTEFDSMLTSLMGNSKFINKITAPGFLDKISKYESNPFLALEDNDFMEAFDILLNNDNVFKLLNSNIKSNFEEVYKEEILKFKSSQ